MIRSILEPSSTIAVGYGTTIVETKSGEVFQGILKQVTDDAVELMGVDGKTNRIAVREIKEQRASALSLMPEGLHATMTVEEFTDLVEYLASLKQPESAVSAHEGMPAEIAVLASPVAVRRFFGEALRLEHTTGQTPGVPRLGLVWFGQIPGMTNSFFAIHQSGKIWLLERDGTVERKTLFADFSPECFSARGPNGLLGLAFHPKFRENRKYYLKHQVYEDGKIATVIVEKQAAPDFRKDSGQPSRRLIKVVSTTQDHSGGCVQFGPDGFLYFGMGDTGPQQDPQGHGQDLSLLLGKMMRIDVDRMEGGLAYAIPLDNPFRGNPAARPEIWAYGFREPWRFSFDSVTGDLWVGDVGQDRVEEVDLVRRGENCGWNVYEAFEPFSNRYRKDGVVYVPPVFAYKRKYGNSVTGGYVYRGDKRSSFYGVYIFGDYTSRRIFGLRQNGRRLQAVRQIGLSPEGLCTFGTDEQGNIYIGGYEGMVYKIDFSGAVFETK